MQSHVAEAAVSAGSLGTTHTFGRAATVLNPREAIEVRMARMTEFDIVAQILAKGTCTQLVP